MTLPQNLEPGQFRKALGSFPTGVTVVTCRDQTSGRPIGITVSSFNSVSLEPPLVLWSLSRKSPHIEHFAAGRRHSIHVLSESQSALAMRFADRSRDKFAGIELTLDTPTAPPSIAGVSARFDCRTEAHYDGGDHIIVLARVTELITADLRPLVFWGGRLMAAPVPAQP